MTLVHHQSSSPAPLRLVLGCVAGLLVASVVALRASLQWADLVVRAPVDAGFVALLCAIAAMAFGVSCWRLRSPGALLLAVGAADLTVVAVVVRLVARLVLKGA
jgi:hypothetical protein